MTESRIFSLNEVMIDSQYFYMESIIDPWGEDDQVVDSIISSRFDETISITIWKRLAEVSETGALFVDVGAYSGIFSLVAAATRGDIRTVAFEPSAITFGRLTRNILINGFDTRIVPTNLAAGSAAKQIVFPHRYGIFSLCSGESAGTEEFDHTQQATLVPLDALLAPSREHPYLNSKTMSVWPYARIVGVKIDVEGAEIDVLNGSAGLFRAYRPAIIAEYLSDEAYRQLNDFASNIDYEIHKIENERNVFMFHRESPVERQVMESAFQSPGSVAGRRTSTMTVARTMRGAS